MPGIAGVIGCAGPEYQRFVALMLSSMKHKPDYVTGVYSDAGGGVYAGWVAHPGSFAARLSACRARHGAVLFFSGECFQSRTGPLGQDGDAEGLLDLYAVEGDRFVRRLNGLFSGLLIDSAAKRAILFNDRYGMERIYYYQRNGATFFASEAKALLRILPELRSFDDRGVSEFLAYGSTMGEQTLFRNMKLLPGGSLWAFSKNGATTKNRYFAAEEWEAQPQLTAEEFESQFEAAFTRVLPPYLSFPKKIGISLTGGLDTRMIMACAGNSERRSVCYTYGGLAGRTLDARIASRIAKICGVDHHILRISTNFLKHYDQYVDRTIFVTDGGAGALGAHEIYFTALARELSPVRLTGNFGSEVLRGVSTFKPVGLSCDLLVKDIRNIVENRVAQVSSEQIHPVTQAAFREIPWHLFGTLAAARSEVIFRTPYLDNDLVRLAFQAPQTVRQSPRSALKVIRNSNPSLGRIPTDRGLAWDASKASAAIRKLFCEVTFKLDYLHHEGLPNYLCQVDQLIGCVSKMGLLNLHKFLPYRKWFKEDLAEYVADSIVTATRQGLPYWNRKVLETIADDHIKGRRNYLREINAIITLEATARLLLQRPAMDYVAGL